MASNETLLCSVVFKFIAMILGVFGNTTVIIYSIFWTKERTATSYMVGNLALADLLMCLTFYPIWIVEFVLTILDIDSDQSLFCKLSRSTILTFLFASVASLLAITFDRYLYIVKPLRYPLIVRAGRVRRVICGIWLTSCFIFAVYFSLTRRLPVRNTCYFPDGTYYTKDVIIAYIPITLILILNFQIFSVARKQRKKILAENMPKGLNDTDNQSANRSNLVLRFLVGLKAAKSFFIVAVVLFLCILTPQVLNMMLCRFCSDSCVRDYFVVFHYEFYGINSIANAFIYGMRHVKYRKAFKNMFLKIIGRFKSVK